MKLSIIIPVRNGGSAFAECLHALTIARAECQPDVETELIVVDDGSSDDSFALAQQAGAIALSTSGGRGPASARNLGAQTASGDILFFCDADVALHPSALQLAAQAFQTDLTLQACFGSYDDEPAAPNFLSQYKNLQHHFVHQQARPQAATFWTGCGAMRTATYLALGGLDEQTYPRPSIEDIDLGYRLRRWGGEIHLTKTMQCKHLKRWTVSSLLRSDFFERGIPWTALLWRERSYARNLPAHNSQLLDLNLQTSSRLSAFLVIVCLASLLTSPFSFLTPYSPLLTLLSSLSSLVCLLALLYLNRAFYQFLLRKRGFIFALRAILWHWFYYLYSLAAFGLGTLQYLVKGAATINSDGTLARSGTRK